LEEFFGSAAGLSASVITRLTTDWQRERDQFSHRSLKDIDYVYLFADGIHFNVRLEEARLCALVIVGVRADGTKELVSITDGHRESAESWSDVLRDLRRRGMRAPVLAVGDGALGFWGALSDVFPDTVHQRCWVHKMANVMNALPKSAQPAARAALSEVRDAEDRERAEQAIERFTKDYEAKWPKAVDKVTKDRDELLAFFDLPAEHWVHLKTTNPIESTFATVRLRTKVTKGPGSRAAGLAMAYKLIESAQARWRAVNAPHLVALVRAGVKFEKGVMTERSGEQDTEVAA
jgi:transposase-like protein